MAINRNKTHLWKADVEASIDFYNDWFLRFAPATYRKQRELRTNEVIDALNKTANLTRITPAILKENPGVLPMLRMVTAPPLARDRLMGLAYVNKNLIKCMEGNSEESPRLPCRMPKDKLDEELGKICDVISELADRDLFPWLDSKRQPEKDAALRAAAVVADRLCGAASDPIIRNAQEKRQLDSLKRWLKKRGYLYITTEKARNPLEMPPGTFTFRLNLPAGKKSAPVNIPIDCVIKPALSGNQAMPILIEAKSAGDATNTNKRRKEEAQKYSQLKERYGQDIHYVLLLCGYFEPSYLGYEASEGIDWVWEHRLDDFDQLLKDRAKKKARATKEEAAVYATVAEAGEAKRFTLQKQVDDTKSQEERNKRGQFSTPHSLALEIVMTALNHVPRQAPISFIEPGTGTGVFFSALRHLSSDRLIKEAVGVEKDSAYAKVASNVWKQYGLTIEVTDFLSFAVDPRQAKRYNLLCTNPPYVRHHHIDPETKQRLQALINTQLGITVSGLSGLYVYFMLLSHSILADGAVAAWLIPSEFLYVNYGKAMRDYLIKHVTLLAIHQFDPEEVKFEDALVSSCIVIYRKVPPAPGTRFLFSFGSDVQEANHVHEIAINNAVLNGKWTSLHFGDKERSEAEGFTISDFFTIRRGLATGANDFFIVDKSVIEQYEIPAPFVKPILPGPRFITESVIEATQDGSPKVQRVKYLIDCDEPSNIVKKRYPGLWKYFQLGDERGVPERYLCASREEWYYQERRAPSPFLATYIGRSQNGTKSPFRFILNLSKAIVTNVYLNLYPKDALMHLLAADESKLLELMNLLNQIPVEEVMRAGRSYGGGLHKIEPKELANVPIGNVPAWMKMMMEKQMVLI